MRSRSLLISCFISIFPVRLKFHEERALLRLAQWTSIEKLAIPIFDRGITVQFLERISRRDQLQQLQINDDYAECSETRINELIETICLIKSLKILDIWTIEYQKLEHVRQLNSALQLKELHSWVH